MRNTSKKDIAPRRRPLRSVYQFVFAVFCSVGIITYACPHLLSPSYSSRARLTGALKVTVINLSRREDRWRLISQRLANLPESFGVHSIGRLNATDGHDRTGTISLSQMVSDGRLSHRAYESIMTAKTRHVTGHDMTAGALGCLLSHAKAWERAVSANASLLVLEDDVELISPNFERDVPIALQELPRSFGLLYLGDMARDQVTIQKHNYSSHLQRLSRPLWGTYAYVISPRAARRLLMHIYPVEVQVDSYIRQVAELYEHDMPNFALARDAVYTDNSPSRDSDVQERGAVDDDGGGAASSGQRSTLGYHVLLPPSQQTGGSSLMPSTHLTFDSSFLHAHPHHPAAVHHHTEEQAEAYAATASPALRHGLSLERSSSSSSSPLTRRWLLCLAIALHYSRQDRGGSLCFSEPFVVLRSLQHLLFATGDDDDDDDDASVAFFMSSDNSLLKSVVYADVLEQENDHERLISAAVEMIIITAGHHQRASSQQPNRPNNTRRGIAVLPPHIFDPLLPLQRPCRCIDLIALTSKDVTQCQSRCDRMIAPPYAAGYAVTRSNTAATAAAGSESYSNQVLHVAAKDVDGHNLDQLKQILPPGWTVRSLPAFATPPKTTSSLHRFCAGVAAVEKHGGVYMDLDRVDRRPQQLLLRGAFELLTSKWTLFAHAKQEQQVVAAAWTQASGSKRLSERFLAAPFPKHPVIRRLSLACRLLTTNLRSAIVESAAELEWMYMKQLQKALADDAWSILFFDQRSIFG